MTCPGMRPSIQGIDGWCCLRQVCPTTQSCEWEIEISNIPCGTVRYFHRRLQNRVLRKMRCLRATFYAVCDSDSVFLSLNIFCLVEHRLCIESLLFWNTNTLTATVTINVDQSLGGTSSFFALHGCSVKIHGRRRRHQGI